MDTSGIAASSERRWVRLGQHVTCRFEAIPLSGYVWEMEACPTGLAAEWNGFSMRRDDLRLGEATAQVFRFRAIRRGVFPVRFLRHASEPGRIVEICTIVVEVV